jgi:membrane-associated protease RseP (regulator of RpoE activity)
MGLYDRDYMRDVLGDPKRSTWLSLRSLPLALVLAVVIGFFALQMLSRYLFPNNWNAVTRVLAMNEVGWAGIGWDGVLPAQQAVLGVPCALKVTEVAPDGPADKAGLTVGDYIVGLNGKPFSDVLELQGNARYFRPGQTITLNVVRAGRSLAVSITLISWSELKKLKITAVAL